MQAGDASLMMPLAGSVSHVFADMLDELQPLRDRCAVVTVGPISSRPNTAGLAAVSSAQPGGTEGRLASAGDGGSATAPSTAQTTNTRSAKASAPATAGKAEALLAKDDEFAVPDSTRQVAGAANAALRDILTNTAETPNALAGGDPWVALANEIAADEAAFLEASAPSLDWARKRFQFFCERDSKAYLIEDVLGDWALGDCPPPEAFVIDAIALAKDHTKHLEETYGYKIPRGLHEVGQVTPAAYDVSATLRKLDEHEPGGSTAPPVFVCADTITKNEATSLQLTHEPSPPLATGTAAGATTHNPRSMKVAAAASGAMTSSASPHKSKAGTTMLKASLQRPQLECDFKTIELRSEPHVTQELIIQLWNVSAYSLRVKLSPSPWVGCLEVAPVDVSTYDPETPMAPGETLKVRVAFRPLDPTSNIALRVETISIGYTRELNAIRVTDTASLTQQWNFLDIPVSCTTILPKPTLLPQESSTNLLETVFSPIWACTSMSQTRTLVNAGSRSEFTVKSTCGAFLVHPPSFVLESGAAQELLVTFCPTHDEVYEGTMEVVATNLAGDSIIASLSSTLRGTGVIPRISFSSVGNVSGAGALADSVVHYVEEDIAAASAESGGASHSQLPCVVPSLVVLEGSATLHTSTTNVVVQNDCVLPVHFQWGIATLGGPCKITAAPATGTIPPKSTVSVLVSTTPLTDSSITTGLLSLYLTGMPSEYERPLQDTSGVFEDDSHVGLWLSRRRFVPTLNKERSDDAPIAPTADPFGIFATSNDPHASLHDDGGNDASRRSLHTSSVSVVDAPQTTSDLFAGAIRIVADPQPLRIELAPGYIESTIDCLTQHENHRTFTLTNFSPRDAHFWLDPPCDSNHPAAVLSTEATAAKKKSEKKMRNIYGSDWMPNSQRQRDDCALKFFPQSGVLRGNSTLEVRCSFTLLRLGHHRINVECYIAELGKEASPTVTFVADAVGPSVHCSTSLLDFGVLAVGDEAEARLTVSNHNPVPVHFQCLDPIPCDPPRFVFLPSSASLLPGKSVDITVYRQGVLDTMSYGDGSQCYFEVVVSEGGTTAIECRATIQQPAASIHPTCLDLGEMDVAIPRESEVFVTNLSAIDIPFELQIVSMPQTMSLLLPSGGVLFGGQCRAPIKLKVQFDRGVVGNEAPDVAVVALTSPRLLQPILFEVTCSRVTPISVALSITTARGDEPPTQAPCLSMETFIAEVLWNVVTTRVLQEGTSSLLFPHCAPIVIPYAALPDDDPFCAVQARLKIENRSGCVSKCLVTGLHYVPLLCPFRAPASSKTTAAVRVATPPNAMMTLDRAPSSLSLANKTTGRTQQHTDTLGTTTKSRHRSHSVTSSSTSVSQRIMKLRPHMPSFDCKAIDGREDVEKAQSALREFAESMLMDGRGCALHVQHGMGPLKPHGTHEVSTTFVANLPGQYYEQLFVNVDGIAPVALNVALTVRGKPIVIDPTTSGLALQADGATQRLTLPSVVAGMSTVKRRMRIASRCPRDLEVDVLLRSVTSSFNAVVITNPDAIRLEGPSAEDDGTQGIASVNPTRIVVPAMKSSEVVIEFAPTSGMTGEWQAQLMITSRIAKTEYNDVFLLDEFYLKNKDRFPSERFITAPGLVATGCSDTVRAVAKLSVQQPLIDRPGVIKDNVIVPPTPTEQLVLDLYRRQLRSTPSFVKQAAAAAARKEVRGPVHPVDESDEEDGDASNDVRSIGKLDGMDKDKLLAIDEERIEVRHYLANRREELYHSATSFFTPTTVTVVGVIMPAQLACDPPQMLRFPMARAGEGAVRSIRLTNPTRTPLDFRVATEGPFKIIALNFLPADSKEDALEEDDDEGANARRQQQAFLKSNPGKKTHLASSSAQLALSSSTTMMSATLGSTRRTDPHSDPCNTLFHLRPRDAVDLTVELNPLSTTQVLHKHQIEGSLQVSFQGCSLTQTIPCLATVHTPSVTCDPESTWFRPPVQLRDGKPQPKYPRSITLINTSRCEAKFTVRNVHRLDAPGSRGGAGGETIQRLRKLQAVLHVSPMEEHATLIDDPTRFSIFPMEGTVPPMSEGGAPGRLVLQINFSEYSNIRYECKYRVDVDGGVGSEFVVRGDSREVEV